MIMMRLCQQLCTMLCVCIFCVFIFIYHYFINCAACKRPSGRLLFNTLDFIQMVTNQSIVDMMGHFSIITGHAYKLYKSHCNHSTRSRFFAERIVLVLNSLLTSVNFTSLSDFKNSLLPVDLTQFLKCT